MEDRYFQGSVYKHSQNSYPQNNPSYIATSSSTVHTYNIHSHLGVVKNKPYLNTVREYYYYINNYHIHTQAQSRYIQYIAT